MWVNQLELVDYRSYRETNLELPDGPVVLIGSNGQGKTNLVEAIGYATTLSSHRVSADAALIRQGCDQALVRLQAHTRSDRSVKIELQINRGRSNLVKVNGNKLPRARDVLGVVTSVVFAPEDIRLVRGDPSDRRRFLDDVMVQVTPRYLGLRTEYERVVKQRNALLKAMRNSPEAGGAGGLAIWDEQLVAIGSELLWGRLNAVRRLAAPMTQAYRQISGSDDLATISYQTSISQTPDATDLQAREDVRAAMSASLQKRNREEIARAITLVGPHRDDLLLSLGSSPAKGFASHGESWSICLALRLASYDVMRELTDDPPVLILDDVFAELDSNRRQRLTAAVSQADQIIVTAAVAEDVPAELGGSAFSVRKDDRSHIEAFEQNPVG